MKKLTLLLTMACTILLASPASAIVDTAQAASTAKPARQCSDGIDNDFDTYIDLADPVCAASGPMGKTESPFNQPPSTTCKPTGLVVVGVSSSSVSLDWGDCSGVTGYKIMQYASDGITLQATYIVSASQATIGMLQPSTTYVFTVTAEYSTGEGPASDPISATTSAVTPPTSGAIPTGTHWGDIADFPAIKAGGFDFVVVNVAPGDNQRVLNLVSAARANGLKLVTGLYDFGGPNPYTLASDRLTWGMTDAARSTINLMEANQDAFLAFFGFNEPMWVDPITGQNNPCGAVSFASLRNFRTMIQSEWPGAKIWHDTGWPSEWAIGGMFHPDCVGDKYQDGTNAMDYNGVFFYPFQGLEYQRQQMIDRINKEKAFTASNMPGVHFAFLAQSQTETVNGVNTPWPTHAQMRDQNCTVRSLLPSGTPQSWYVWRQEIYLDYLVNHQDYMPDMLASSC